MSHSPLLLQLVIIIATARLLGLALRFLGQPAVIGEMAAGIVLGPIVFGALAGGALGARLSGQPWRTSLAVGSLMNARGLMELIVMKVGLDTGVIGPEMFTMPLFQR